MRHVGRDPFSVNFLEKGEYFAPTGRERDGRPETLADVYFDYVRQDAFDRPRGLIMEPSIFVNEMTTSYEYGRDDEGLYAQVSCDWSLSDEAHELVGYWRELHGDERISDFVYTKTQLSLACGALVYNEMPLKLIKAQKTGGRVEEIVWGNPSLVESIARITEFVGSSLIRLSEQACIGEHTERFIKEHKDSSVAPGLKWPEVTDEGLVELLRSTRDVYSWIGHNIHEFDLRNDEAPQWAVSPFSNGYGMRARSPDGLEPLSGHFYGRMRRTRQIMFCPPMSAIWAFIPDHHTFYKEYISTIIRILDFDHPVHSPILDGGKVWELAYSDMEGGKYHNHDGSAWEVHVPEITGRSLPFATILGLLQGASGYGFTTLEGIDGHLILQRGFEDYFPEVHIISTSIHGDDNGVVYEDNSRILPDIPGLYERDPIASTMKHFLGLCMLDDEYWHPLGIKLTVDRSDKGRRIIPGSTNAVTLKRSYDTQTVQIVLSSYKGMVIDGTPFREVLRGMDFRGLDYISPSTIRELVIQDQQEAPAALNDLELRIGKDRPAN